MEFGIGRLVGVVLCRLLWIFRFGWRCGIALAKEVIQDFGVGIGDFSPADGGDVVAKGIAGFFPGRRFGFVIGAEHAVGFFDGLDDVSITCVGGVDDPFEPVEEFLAGEACLVAVVMLKAVEISLCIVALEEAGGGGACGFPGGGVSGTGPGFTRFAGLVVDFEEAFLAGIEGV